MLQTHQEQAVPQISFLSWSSRPPSKNIRQRVQKGGLRQLPLCDPSNQPIKRAHFSLSLRSSSDHFQQISDEKSRKRRVPFTNSDPSLARPSDKQNAFVCWGRSTSNRNETCFWKSFGKSSQSLSWSYCYFC